MQIKLCVMQCESFRIDKTKYITKSFDIQGTLRNESSVIDPTIVIEKENLFLSGVKYNYMYIKEFGRWYFINEIISIVNNIWEIHCHVDVLYSWMSDILNSYCIIDKTEDISYADMYLDDGTFVMDSKKYSTIISYPNGFQESGNYILVAAGGD